MAFSPAVGAAFAAVLAGWLYTLTVRLRPVAVAPWLAPLPLLLLAPRVPGVIVGVAAGIAWGSGQLVLWRYWTRVLSMPAPLAVAQIVSGSSGVAAIMLLARTQLVAGRLVLAAVTVPVAWVTLEFLVSVRSVHGAWWSVAYTQGDLPVVLQIASVTGSSGLAALLSFPAAVIAAVVTPVGSAVERVTVGAVSATGLAALAMWAVRRARSVTTGTSVHAGLAAEPGSAVPVGLPVGQRALASYVERVRQLARRGATVVVLPEVTFTVEDDRMVDLLRPLDQVAAEQSVQLVVGVGQQGPSDRANLALVFGGKDGQPARYRKQHLVPVLEDQYRPGQQLLFLGEGEDRRGVLICKDLDFPQLARAYRRGGARMLLAPAWDFDSDGWLHSRMAVVRGVESGLTLARIARGGLATISDAYGRVIAEADTAQGVSLDAVVPMPEVKTAYGRFGDWFAWCCVMMTAALVILAVI